jgi:hypothetical protein
MSVIWMAELSVRMNCRVALCSVKACAKPVSLVRYSEDRSVRAVLQEMRLRDILETIRRKEAYRSGRGGNTP